MRQEPAGNVRMFQPLESVQGRQAQHDGLRRIERKFQHGFDRRPISQFRESMQHVSSFFSGSSMILDHLPPQGQCRRAPQPHTESHPPFIGWKPFGDVSNGLIKGRSQRFYP